MSTTGTSKGSDWDCDTGVSCRAGGGVRFCSGMEALSRSPREFTESGVIEQQIERKGRGRSQGDAATEEDLSRGGESLEHPLRKFRKNTDPHRYSGDRGVDRVAEIDLAQRVDSDHGDSGEQDDSDTADHRIRQGCNHFTHSRDEAEDDQNGTAG